MKEECSKSFSSKFGVAERICITMTIKFSAYQPSYSGPNIRIVSHVRIQEVPLFNIYASHSATVKFAKKIEAHVILESTNTGSMTSILND